MYVYLHAIRCSSVYSNDDDVGRVCVLVRICVIAVWRNSMKKAHSPKRVLERGFAHPRIWMCEEGEDRVGNVEGGRYRNAGKAWWRSSDQFVHIVQLREKEKGGNTGEGKKGAGFTSEKKEARPRKCNGTYATPWEYLTADAHQCSGGSLFSRGIHSIIYFPCLATT